MGGEGRCSWEEDEEEEEVSRGFIVGRESAGVRVGLA
jgi:hypothetical protein